MDVSDLPEDPSDEFWARMVAETTQRIEEQTEHLMNAGMVAAMHGCVCVVTVDWSLDPPYVLRYRPATDDDRGPLEFVL